MTTPEHPGFSSNLHVNDRWRCAWNGQELFQIEAPQHFHNIDNNKSALDGTKTWSCIKWCFCCSANMKDLQQTQRETHQGVAMETHKQRIHWDPDLTENILIIFNKHHLVANSGVIKCYKYHQFQISRMQTRIFRFSLFHSFLFIWRLLMIPQSFHYSGPVVFAAVTKHRQARTDWSSDSGHWNYPLTLQIRVFCFLKYLLTPPCWSR